MKKLFIGSLLALVLSAPALAINNPKLDALVLTPPTEFTVPQFCDKFGWMLTDVVRFALKKGDKYTINNGQRFVQAALKNITKTSGLKIQEGWKMYAIGVLPVIPTFPTFKDRMRGVKHLSLEYSTHIYDVGSTTCLESLTDMEAEKKVYIPGETVYN